MSDQTPGSPYWKELTPLPYHPAGVAMIHSELGQTLNFSDDPDEPGGFVPRAVAFMAGLVTAVREDGQSRYHATLRCAHIARALLGEIPWDPEYGLWVERRQALTSENQLARSSLSLKDIVACALCVDPFDPFEKAIGEPLGKTLGRLLESIR